MKTKTNLDANIVRKFDQSETGAVEPPLSSQKNTAKLMNLVNAPNEAFTGNNLATDLLLMRI